MGQKVHPKGLRLGVIYDWNSRWFFSSKKAYREALISDTKLREALFKKLDRASVTQIDIERAIKKIKIFIYTVKPGIIIGRGGKSLEELKDFILENLNLKKKKSNTKLEIKIEPVKKPYLNAHYVAQGIALKLVRNFSHRSVVHRVMDKVMESGAKGIKIQLGGRIAGAEISRKEKYFQGSIPTSTIREDIDFSNFPALTKSGYIGVKVWICRKK